MKHVHSVLSLVVGILCLAVAAQGQLVDVVRNVEDYITQSERQYAARIKNIEAQLDAYRVSYKRQVNGIGVHSALIEAKLIDLEDSLSPLSLLEGSNKYCVLKYNNRLKTVAEIKASLDTCAKNANSPIENFLSASNTVLRNMINYLNNQHKTGLSNCQKNNINSQQNYTICVTQVINATNLVFSNNQKNFNQQLETAECSADNRIKLALDCSFTALYNAITTIGEVSVLIKDCIEGVSYCPACSEKNSCSNAIDFSLTDADFRSTTIRNPFVGFNSTVPCVLVNLRRPV